MNWFWNNWYFSNYYIDLAINDVKKNKNDYAVSIKNIGGFAAPVDVVATYDDGSSETFHQTPAIWEADQKQTTVNISTKKKIISVQLNGGIWMDADERNNSFKL